MKLCKELMIIAILPMFLCGSRGKKDIKEKIDSKSENEKPSIVQLGKKYYQSRLRFSPNGKLAAICNYKSSTISIFAVDLATGRFTPAKQPTISFKRPSDIAFSPNGELAAVTSFLGDEISVFKIDYKAEAFTLLKASTFKIPLIDYIEGSRIVFSPNGHLIAATNPSNETVTMVTVDYNTGMLAEVQGSPFKTNGDHPHAIAFSPNGELLSVVHLSGESKIIFFTFGGYTEKITLEFPPLIVDKMGWNTKSIKFSPDGKLAVVTFLGKPMDIFTVDYNTGKFTSASQSITESVEDLAFSGDMAAVITGQNKIKVYRVNTQNGAFTAIKGVSAIPTGKYPRNICFSPDGQLAVVLNNEGGNKNDTLWIYEFDNQTGEMTPITGKLLKARAHEYVKTKQAFDQLSKSDKENKAFGEVKIPQIDDILSGYIAGASAAEAEASAAASEVENKKKEKSSWFSNPLGWNWFGIKKAE